MGFRNGGELVPKLVWRVKLVAEFEARETTEVEVARLERNEQAGVADLGLRLAERTADGHDPGGDCPGTGDGRRQVDGDPKDPATVVQIFPAIQSFNLLFGNAPT